MLIERCSTHSVDTQCLAMRCMVFHQDHAALLNAASKPTRDNSRYVANPGGREASLDQPSVFTSSANRFPRSLPDARLCFQVPIVRILESKLDISVKVSVRVLSRCARAAKRASHLPCATRKFSYAFAPLTTMRVTCPARNTTYATHRPGRCSRILLDAF
jgi:hypothetical protein